MAHIISLARDTSVAKADINKGYVFLICTITALGGVLFGFDLVTISGAIQFLSSHFELNDYEKGWAVGCINLGCIGGSLCAGWLSDRWGRKKLLILCAILFAITGIGTGWASSFNWFVSFRLLSGVAVGAAALICPMYTAEISPAHLRGRMVSFYQLAITIGILLAYVSNYLLLDMGSDNWRWMFTAQSVPAIFFFLGLLFVAESPRWLIRKGRVVEAGEILSRIGGSTYASQQVNAIVVSFSHEVKERVVDIFKRKFLVILFIGVSIAFFSQAVGQNSLFSYAPENTTINEAISYMQKHFDKRITVEELAKYTSTSPSLFFKKFKKSTGYSPVAYFNLLKIQKAIQLIHSLKYNISEVGSRVGIDDPYYFSRLFKKLMGLSPRMYIKEFIPHNEIQD